MIQGVKKLKSPPGDVHCCGKTQSPRESPINNHSPGKLLAMIRGSFKVMEWITVQRILELEILSKPNRFLVLR